MHKETVNTFTKGMVKDTHPLTTPSDVLTDCLNGTLITYNGNEMILQNDMGNVQIGSAALPDGYIPVGITEYGGIIYVASYNPKTKKGQIGSFPSPQQVHQSEIWNVNNSSATITQLFNSSDFYKGNNIVKTEIKYDLGLVSGKDSYIIHTGDKITINIQDNALNNEFIQAQFAILKNDGSLEVVEGNYLDGEAHVYTGKSSGVPMLIVKLLTLKSFNLERKYSRGSQANTVRITFTGKFEEENPNSNTQLGYSSTDSNYSTPANTPYNVYQTADLSINSNSPYTQNFIPVLSYGNLISMKKSVSIDLSKFKQDKYELSDWSYYITDSYAKVNWSFDNYTLDDNKQVTKIEFKFHDISNISSVSYTYEIEKENYSGSFEDIINFNEGFTKNNIYLVKVTGTLSDNSPKHIGNRLIYTSGIFNEYYGKVKDFTNKGFRKDLPEVMWRPRVSTPDTQWDYAFRKELVIKIKPTIEVTNDGNNITIQNPSGNQTTLSKNNIRGTSFIMLSDDRGSGYYNIFVNNRYNFKVNLTAEVKQDSKIVGYPTQETIEALLESFANSELVFHDESQKLGTLTAENTFDIALQDFNQVYNHGIYHAGETYNTCSLYYDNVTTQVPSDPQQEVPPTGIVIQSKIRAKASAVKNEEIERTGLAPLYSSDMRAADKDKIFTGWNVNKPLFATGADENDFHYNATIAGGTIVTGTDTDAGSDDNGLWTAMEQMGNPMVSMVAGIDGDEASYQPDPVINDFTNNLEPTINQPFQGKLCRRNVAGWNCGDQEIDGTDDWLITTWKQTDGKYRFSVLASHRQHNPVGRLARLDYMLRCLLSQLFVKQHYRYNLKYVTVNPDEYGYYNPVISVEVDLQQIPVDQTGGYNNVSHNVGDQITQDTDYDIAINNHMIYQLLKQDYYSQSGIAANPNTEGITDDEIMLIKYDIVTEIGDSKKLFTQDSYVEEVANLLNGATYNSSAMANDKSNENWIYVPDWSKIASSITETNFIYSNNPDGTIEWLVNDMTPYLKLSGTQDRSGYVYVDDQGINMVSQNGDNFSDEDTPYYYVSQDNTDPLSLTTGSPSSKNININTDSNYNRGPIGDILKWNGHNWPFYHSFQHMFMTTCAMNGQSVNQVEHNEILVNRNENYAGSQNSSGTWTNKKDANAPDIVACLGNSYNSIYGRLGEETSGVN